MENELSPEQLHELVEYLKDALNDSRYCEHHYIYRTCSEKELQCGDCLVRCFLESIEES